MDQTHLHKSIGPRQARAVISQEPNGCNVEPRLAVSRKCPLALSCAGPPARDFRVRETAKRAFTLQSVTNRQWSLSVVRIAVLSDTHSRTVSVLAALQIMAERGVELILHCGDIQDAAAVRLFPAHTHFVFGNTDSDRDDIARAIADIGATLHGAWGQLELAEQALAFVHGDDSQLLRDLERADAFDFLFHGHTHIAREHRTGKTRVINPGALQRVAVRTFSLLDLPSGTAERVTVEV
jgi:uncharacterized protein